MPAPYSYDLRIKVIEAIDGGMGKTQASKIFNISRNTINLWLNKREQTGDYRAKKGYQQGYGAKIPNLEKFREFARKHGNQTQQEMAQAWEEEISDRTIGKALKKIGFTRKKNLRISRKR
jgi:transposase